MKVLEHRLRFNCPKCDKPVTILNLFATRMGDFILEALCVPCGKQLEFKSTIQRIIVTCCELDVLTPMEQQLEDDTRDEGDEE